MGTPSSNEKPTLKVESPRHPPLRRQYARHDVFTSNVEPEKWYQEENNKNVVIDKINDISEDKTSVELKDGFFLKLVDARHFLQLAIINSKNDLLILGASASPDYKNEFTNKIEADKKKQIEADMKRQNGGKKKTRRNQKTKKYRKNRRKTNRRKK